MHGNWRNAFSSTPCQVKERINIFLDNVAQVSESWKRAWALLRCIMLH